MVKWEKSTRGVDPSSVERAWHEFLERELDPLQRTVDSERSFEESLRARPKQCSEVSQRGSKGGRRKLSGPRHQHGQTGGEIFRQVRTSKGFWFGEKMVKTPNLFAMFFQILLGGSIDVRWGNGWRSLRRRRRLSGPELQHQVQQQFCCVYQFYSEKDNFNFAQKRGIQRVIDHFHVLLGVEWPEMSSSVIKTERLDQTTWQSSITSNYNRRWARRVDIFYHWPFERRWFKNTNKTLTWLLTN